MNKQTRTEIFLRFQQQNPKPTTELIYHSNFELLIAVILSAQATDISVNKATKHLFAVANSAQQMFDLGVDKLKSFIKSIGLYNTKAQNVIATCQILVNQFQGEVPHCRKALESLPGVGRKTANVVLNTAFGEPTIAVDTHIFRVANRLGLVKEKTPLAVEQQLLKNTPSQFLQDAHHWLILHGRYVCMARRPQCGQCIVRDLCEYKDKTDV